MLRGIRFWAIMAGVAVDVGASIGSGIIVGCSVIWYGMVRHTPLKDVFSLMADPEFHRLMPVLLAILGLGGFSSLIGGFTTGWVARSHEAKNGLLTGVVSTLVGIPFWDACATWYVVLGVTTTIVSAWAGAFLAPIILKRQVPLAPN